MDGRFPPGQILLINPRIRPQLVGLHRYRDGYQSHGQDHQQRMVNTEKMNPGYARGVRIHTGKQATIFAWLYSVSCNDLDEDLIQTGFRDLELLQFQSLFDQGCQDRLEVVPGWRIKRV
jgi:hypothetical protein